VEGFESYSSQQVGKVGGNDDGLWSHPQQIRYYQHFLVISEQNIVYFFEEYLIVQK